MKNRILTGITLMCVSFLAGTVFAVEPPKPVIILFNETGESTLAGIDIATNSGIEAIGLSGTLQVLGVSNPDNVKTRRKMKLRVKRSTSNKTLGTYVAYVDTKGYPNPELQEGTSYFCDFDGFQVVDPTQDDFPCDWNGNGGIANAGATRYLVFSQIMGGSYWTPNDGFVEIGQASVTIFNPENQATLWRKQFKLQSGDWFLDEDFCAVGDYLSDDGVDEVRIVYVREKANGSNEFRYSYYNIATGALVKENTFSVSAP